MVSSTQDKLLISVEPRELNFPYERKKQTSCKLRLSNNTQQPVAYKILTTNPKEYCVRPNIGLILARSTCEITVLKQAPKDKASSDVECKDKFKIKSVVAKEGTTTENAWKLFKEPEDDVEETKLRVTYIFPAQTDSSRSHRARSNASSVQQMVRLLDVEPQELTFPFEVGKEASCQLLLSNNTLLTVAFKVMTTDAKKYCVRPNNGLILAGSTCDVTVCMRCPKKATSDIECKDKFLIKSVIAKSAGTSRANVYELFKEPKCAVEDFKLRVKYVLPSQTESSDYWRARKDTPVNASTVKDGSLNHSEVTPDTGKKWSSLRRFMQKIQHFWLPNQEKAASDTDGGSFYHELGDRE